jgi:group I intron endonuclease
MSEIYLIYAIRNTKTNERYIGSTKNLKARNQQHFAELRRDYHSNRYLQRAFDKYGERSFVVEVVEEDVPESIISSRENHWINHFDSYKNGYNVVIGVRSPSRRESEEEDPRDWIHVIMPTEVRLYLHTLASQEGFMPEYRTKKRSAGELGFAAALELMVHHWGTLSDLEKEAAVSSYQAEAEKKRKKKEGKE